MYLENIFITSFDPNGNIVEDLSYHPNESLDGKYIHKYDSDGNMVEHGYYKSDGSLEWKIISKYDSLGNMIKRSHFDSDGNLTDIYRVSKEIYKYDSDGNKIEESKYNSDGNLVINFEDVDENYILVKRYFNMIKNLWNNSHDILIRGFDVNNKSGDMAVVRGVIKLIKETPTLLGNYM